MTRQLQIISIFTVQLIITSCTGYGLYYDDKRSPIDQESSEYEYNCLKQPTSECLLTSAAAVTMAMSDEVVQAESLNILAKTHFELDDTRAALSAITEIPVLSVQFSTLFELSYLAKKQNQPQKIIDELLVLAEAITLDLEQPSDKISALLLNAILLFDNQNPQKANKQLNQAITLAKKPNDTQNSISLRFFKKILPKLMQFDSTEVINELIALPAEASLTIAAQVEYTVLLKENKPEQAEKQLNELLTKWPNLTDKQQQQLAQTSIVRLLVVFNRLKLAREIMLQQPKLVARATINAVIIQQLTAQGNIEKAKLTLVHLLRDIRINSKSVLTVAPNALPAIKQQAMQDDFTLNNLRAQAIADIALALSEANQMTEAVHFATQIQRRMGHIQGYTLTKLALQYAKAGDVNAALLTMESIYRPVNRAACLAQISAEVAKKSNKEDLDRAIVIAGRINRQSWLDIANSEISITQAKLKDISAAIKTLNSIQRSFSAVYAMTEIARTLQVPQNKR